jgi:sugar phosphate isomerase/epimerase
MAEDCGIKFAVEADPPCFVQNLERVERLLEMVDYPHLFVNFDPTNYYIAGSDPLKVIERIGHLLINGHIKDGIYRQEKKGEVAIGEGEVEYPEIFRALMAKKMDIVMSIEHCRTPEQVASAAAHIKKVLAQIDSG